MSFLIVTQALPGSGKTIITSFLQRQFNFIRLSVEDDLRKRYGKNWWATVKKNSPWWWHEEFQKALFRPTEESLRKGRNVVVDTVIGATKSPENHYRIENLFLRNRKAESYLLEIVAKSSIRYRRIAERNRISMVKAKGWDNTYLWRKRWQPQGIPVKVLRYTNNTPKDLERIKKDLKSIFKK